MRLVEASKKYVVHKQATVRSCRNVRQLLASFLEYAGSVGFSQISPEVAKSLLGTPNRASAFESETVVLRKFFGHWTVHEKMPQLRMPARPVRASIGVNTYLFTSDEMGKILGSCYFPQTHKRCRLDSITLRTALMLLYGAGMAVCELLDLRRAHVSLKRNHMGLEQNV
jgi:integrase/recombinase XerD